MEHYSEEFSVCPHCGYVEGAKAVEALQMEPGTIMGGRYIVGRVLGFGGFGVTYIGWDALLEQKVAIKEYLPSEFSTRVPGQTQVTVFNGVKEEQFTEGLDKFVEEAQRLAKFHSMDGIVKIYDSFKDNNTAYIIMECLEGETLAELLKRENMVPPERAIEMIMPIIKSLQLIHEQGVIHRDIAPDNIFLTKDGQVKLIDFGAARFATTALTRSLTVMIKPGYSPEEQYRSRGDQGPHTDVYAVGATLYRMITGSTLPEALERRAYYESKQKDVLKPLSAFVKDIDENHETAILNALNVRIEDRTPDMATFEAELTSEDIVPRRQGRIKKIDVLKWPLWTKITATASALTVIVIGILFATGVIDLRKEPGRGIEPIEGMVTVPSIVNNTLDEGERRLDDARLNHMVARRENSDRIAAGMILAQDVDPGYYVAEYTMVNLTISAGAETVVLPEVSGLNVGEAVEALEALNLDVIIDFDYSRVFAANTVIAQSVEAGDRVQVGSTVELTVSMGIDPNEDIEEVPREVPLFVGMAYRAAQTLMQTEGFVFSIQAWEYSDEYDKDVVMWQSAPAGTMLLTGSTIQLTVSLGENIFELDDVVYEERTAAVTLLEGKGLKVEVELVKNDDVRAGLVITQQPAAYTRVRPGDTVRLTVSEGGESFPMPNVVGMSEAAARAELSSKGISVTVDHENSSSPAGTVTKQSIPFNTQVNKGAAVVLTVSSGPAETLISMPNVVGMNESRARSEVGNAGFQSSVSYAESSTVPQGNVISQYPAAGTTHSKGTTATLTVSSGPPPRTVPNVAGMTQAAAENALRGQGFNVNLSPNEYSDTVPSGHVIKQYPAANTSARAGDTVTLTISAGKQTATVPHVTGISRQNATTAITNAGLSYSIVEAFDDIVPRDNVISQNPPGGMVVNRNETVYLTVSKGRDPDKIDSIELTPPSLIVGKGKSSQITIALTPSNASRNGIVWTSSNTSVATVNSSGQVTGVSEGRATITARTPNGKTATCSVTVTEISVTLDNKTLTLDGGQSYQLNALIGGMQANDAVTWTVSGTGVTVSQTGLVKADVPHVTSISLSSTSATVDIGMSARITATVNVSGSGSAVTVTATSKDDRAKSDSCAVTVKPPDDSVTWTSSDSSIVQVTDEGLFLARANGVATLTAASKADPTKTATCRITVETDEVSRVTGINTQPNKTVYLPGETIDLTGFSFQVRYASNKTGVELYPSSLIRAISPYTVPEVSGTYSILIEFTTGDTLLVYYAVIEPAPGG